MADVSLRDSPALWDDHPSHAGVPVAAPAGDAGGGAAAAAAAAAVDIRPTRPPVLAPPAACAVLGQAVLQLHRGSRQWPGDRFDARAAELLREQLPFDALLWGSTRASALPGSALSPHGLYAFGLPASLLVQCLQGLLPAGALSATLHEPLAQRRVELHLWRHGGPAFDEADRQMLALLLPHLVETQRENRLAQPARSGDGDELPPPRSVALCDTQGVLHHIDEPALILLRHEWPRWNGGRLPEALAGAVAAARTDDDAEAERQAAAGTAAIRAVTALAVHDGAAAAPGPGIPPRLSGGCPPAWRALPAFYGRQITVRLARSGDGMWLEVRRRADADRLSRRQRDIAQRYAQGLTGPQIAQQLGLTPSTVNNHLGVVFKKLSVRNKLQLLQALRAAGVPAAPVA